MSGIIWCKIINSVKNIGHFPHSNLFILSLFLTIFFLAIELLARIQDLYIIWPPIDFITHFLGGMAMGSLVLWFYSLSNKNNRKILVMIWVLLLSIGWELIEMAEEAIFPETIPQLRDYFFWDGFFDIILALIGALVFFQILYFLKNKTRLFAKFRKIDQ